MNCPHCQHDIPDEAIAKYLASKGGQKSRRKITPEQQAKMQEARRKNNVSEVGDENKM